MTNSITDRTSQRELNPKNLSYLLTAMVCYKPLI